MLSYGLLVNVNRLDMLLVLPNLLRILDQSIVFVFKI